MPLQDTQSQPTASVLWARNLWRSEVSYVTVSSLFSRSFQLSVPNVPAHKSHVVLCSSLKYNNISALPAGIFRNLTSLAILWVGIFSPCWIRIVGIYIHAHVVIFHCWPLWFVYQIYFCAEQGLDLQQTQYHFRWSFFDSSTECLDILGGKSPKLLPFKAVCSIKEHVQIRLHKPLCGAARLFFTGNAALVQHYTGLIKFGKFW